MGRRCRYSDLLILKLLLWAVIHDRPRCFALEPGNFSALFHPRRLPSYSQFNRRLKKPRILRLLAAAIEYLARTQAPVRLEVLDSKPLLVNEQSRDRDAHTGYAYGHFARGYRVHVLTRPDHMIEAAAVTSLNAGDPDTARQALVPAVHEGARVLADANYDSDRLYRAVDKRKGRLLTPLKGRARSPERLRRMSAGRRWAIRLWDRWPRVCSAALEARDQIERSLGLWTNFGGGLGPLPNFVRHLDRVQPWILAKAVIHDARLRARRAA